MVAMRRISLRGMLAVVALALQALSAAYALGAPIAGAHGRGDFAYCEAAGVESDRRAPAGGHRDAGACLTCQLCLGGFSPLLPYSLAGRALDRRRVADADWSRDAVAGVGSGRAHAHGARAPPAFS